MKVLWPSEAAGFTSHSEHLHEPSEPVFPQISQARRVVEFHQAHISAPWTVERFGKAVANALTVIFDLVQVLSCDSSTATSIDKLFPLMWIRPTRHLQQVKLVACNR